MKSPMPLEIPSNFGREPEEDRVWGRESGCQGPSGDGITCCQVVLPTTARSGTRRKI